jgi:excisionase family DNA binding protein
VIGWVIPHRLAVKHGLTIVDAVRQAYRVAGEEVPTDLHEHLEALARLCVDYRDQLGQRVAKATAVTPEVQTVHSCGSVRFIGERLTAQQVAAQIGTSPSYVVRLCRDGRLTAHQLPNRCWEIDAASVDDYTEARHDRTRAE